MVPSYVGTYESFSPLLLPTTTTRNPCFDDEWLLPRRSGITNNTFRGARIPPRTRSYSARRPISRNNKNSFQITYTIHDGFTFSEKLIIEKALQIVANRSVKREIQENMYEICGESCYQLASGVWSRSQLSNHKNYHGPHDLLQYQLMCLKVKGEKDEFPTIHIYPIYEESHILGRGEVGCVSFISHGSTFSTHDEFDINLNRYNLDAPGTNGLDPVFWAGTIVHEMLHNLGHRHEAKGYNNIWQIDVFKKCFVHNGNYSLH
ncbi:unnamed protein product [Rotaria sp. Silwood2]|nr:unnamed protein product [Rotaria sp. Silwood2]CAF2857264.1 unnamed protein product [Rotaria sp. Silwood2]CAF3308362.1 unnamed protein product [Rotaria sp. Silwood2]CAF4245059.1 unnamed protein product [Rotaria sp. Silwood2]CAF4341103.1 unnamed protein product [Rotaria sp. Silwood2]